MSRALVIDVKKAVADKQNEFGLYQGIYLLHEKYEADLAAWREEHNELRATWEKEKLQAIMDSISVDNQVITSIDISSSSYHSRLESNPEDVSIRLNVKRGSIDFSDWNARIQQHNDKKPTAPQLQLNRYYDKRGNPLHPRVVMQTLTMQLNALKQLSDDKDITISLLERINQMRP